MHYNPRTCLRDRLLLVLVAAGIAGLMALVLDKNPWPRLFAPAEAPSSAHALLPPSPTAIRRSETKDVFMLKAAFDRIGFDLDSVAAGYISVPRVILASLPANMARADGAEGRKAVFLRMLLPIVLDVDDRIAEDRARLLAMREKVRNNVSLTGQEVEWVMALADSYDQPDADLDALVRKVDVVPPSLALAQAIEESGWGTSRIARDYNALFGQFGQADGEAEAHYRSFTNLTEAVEAYARNLNTHRAYREFRQARAKMRTKSGGVDSRELAASLHRYSERGEDYVQTLRSIMRDNELDALDGARLSSKRGSVIVESRADGPAGPVTVLR